MERALVKDPLGRGQDLGLGVPVAAGQQVLQNERLILGFLVAPGPGDSLWRDPGRSLEGQEGPSSAASLHPCWASACPLLSSIFCLPGG